MMMAKRSRLEQPEFVVYRASDWRLYHDSDPKAELIEDGLYWWEAHRLCNELNMNSGMQPTGGYKVCYIDDWKVHLMKYKRRVAEIKPLQNEKCFGQQMSLFELG